MSDVSAEELELGITRLDDFLRHKDGDFKVPTDGAVLAAARRELDRMRAPMAPVGGDWVEGTIDELARSAQVCIAEEQAKAAPDNHYIAVFCNTVRLCRESNRLARSGLRVEPVRAPTAGAPSTAVATLREAIAWLPGYRPGDGERADAAYAALDTLERELAEAQDYAECHRLNLELRKHELASEREARDRLESQLAARPALELRADSAPRKQRLLWVFEGELGPNGDYCTDHEPLGWLPLDALQAPEDRKDG